LKTLITFPKCAASAPVQTPSKVTLPATVEDVVVGAVPPEEDLELLPHPAATSASAPSAARAIRWRFMRLLSVDVTRRYAFSNRSRD
jgi:hypothetical protein